MKISTVVVLAVMVAAPAAAQTYTCIRTGAGGLLDLQCTEDVAPPASPDFRVTPTSGPSAYAFFRVVALSRPFGAVVIDAEIECSDGTFAEAEDATEPLAVGQAGGQVSFRVAVCATGHNRITLSPRFPEWKCDGCVEYVPSR